MTEEVPLVALDYHSLARLLARSEDSSGMPRNLSEGSEVSNQPRLKLLTVTSVSR